jgi:hypothetical protein
VYPEASTSRSNLILSAGMVLVNLTSMLLMKPQVRPDGGDTKPTCLLCTTGLAGLGG